MAKRIMLGLPWTEGRKHAFERVALELRKTKAEFGREILEAVLECMLSAEEATSLGLITPWSETARGRRLLEYILNRADGPEGADAGGHNAENGTKLR